MADTTEPRDRAAIGGPCGAYGMTIIRRCVLGTGRRLTKRSKTTICGFCSAGVFLFMCSFICSSVGYFSLEIVIGGVSVILTIGMSAKCKSTIKYSKKRRNCTYTNTRARTHHGDRSFARHSQWQTDFPMNDLVYVCMQVRDTSTLHVRVDTSTLPEGHRVPKAHKQVL